MPKEALSELHIQIRIVENGYQVTLLAYGEGFRRLFPSNSRFVAESKESLKKILDNAINQLGKAEK